MAMFTTPARSHRHTGEGAEDQRHGDAGSGPAMRSAIAKLGGPRWSA